VPILLVASFCLTWQLDAKSLWIDEIFTADIARQATPEAVITAVQETEGRPPLYYLLVHYWTRAAGNSDFLLRFLSVAFAIVGLPLLFNLTRRLTDGHVAFLTIALMTFSPLYLLYSRMARAYFLAVCLALASSYFFIRLIDRESQWSWGGYILSTWGLLYTDYMTASILLVQNVWMFIFGQRPRKLWSRWLVAQCVLVIGFLPWLPSLLGQGARYQSPTMLADLSQGWKAYLVKLAQPVLVFSLGETIFPWNPVALIGLPVIMALTLIGTISAWRNRPHGLLIILSTVIPILFTVFIVTGLIVRYMTFAWIGARTLQALPFYLLLTALGLRIVRPSVLRYGLAAIVAIAFLVSDVNYFLNREFHNPVYVIPSKEIVRHVMSQAQVGDVILASRDSGFAYYYPPGAPYHIFDLDYPEAARMTLVTSPRVWIVTVSRDRGRASQPSEFTIWFESLYAPVGHWGYAEQPADYRHFKEALIKREAYQYKAELSLYQRHP